MTSSRNSRTLTRLSIASALAASLLLSACGGEQGDAKDHLAKAEDFAAKGDIRAVVIELKNALKKDPKLAQARLMLGRTYVGLEAGPEAIKELERAIELGAEAPDTMLLLAQAHALAGDPKRSLAISEEHAPTSGSHDWLIVRANAKLALGDTAEAKELYEKALELKANSQSARRGLARVTIAGGGSAKDARSVLDAAADAATDRDTLLLRGELELSMQNFEEARKDFEKAVAADGNSFAARLGLARALLGEEKTDAAAAAIAPLVKGAPKDPRINFVQALIARQSGDVPNAQKFLQEVLNVVPDHAQSLLLGGQLHYLQREFEQAETLLARYVNRIGSDLSARKLLAAVYVELKQPQNAIDTLNVVEQRTPDDAQMLALMGTAYMNLKDFETGKQYLDRASHSAPEAAPIRTQLALSHLATGSPESAVTELEAAIEKDPAFARADYLLVLTHFQKRDFDAALVAAQTLLSKQPESPQAMNIVAAAHEGRGDLVSAEQMYRQALAADPTYMAAALNISRLALARGENEAAKKGYDEILEKDANNAFALVALAQIASSEGRAQEGVALLERARDKNPEALQPRLILSAYYLRQRQPAEALTIAREAEKYAPDHPAVRLSIGRALSSTGDARGAVATLGKLAKEFPDSPDTHFHLAVGHAQLGRSDEARAALERVLELRPDNLIAMSSLGNLELRADNLDAALVIAKKLQTVNPDVPAGFILEADIAAKRGETARAIELYRATMTRSPNPATVLKLYEALQRSGQTADALGVLNARLDAEPADSTVRLVRASASHQSGAKEQAIADYERVLSAQPDNVLALNNLAWLYMEKQDPRAFELAERAYRRIPDRPEIADTYGWFLIERGQVEQGLAILEKALRDAPDNRDIAYHRAAGVAKSGEKSRAADLLDELLSDGEAFPERAAAQALRKTLK